MGQTILSRAPQVSTLQFFLFSSPFLSVKHRTTFIICILVYAVIILGALFRYGSTMVKLDIDVEKGGMELDRQFLVDFGADKSDILLAHEMR